MLLFRASGVGPSVRLPLFQFLSISLFLPALLVFVACGGHSSSTTTTTGVAPTFTSTVPQIVSEGILYTYNITATTTDGSTVTYALTTGPTGAAVSGSTLTWTPTHAQARISNSFTITATTSKNGSATQTFTLTPNGIINGTVIDHHVTTGGLVDAPQDLSAVTVEVLFPNGQGGYNTLHGTGDSSGNFSIPNVPPGSFWLHLPRTSNGTTANDYIWTNSSDIDAGALALGRPGAISESSGVTVHASGITATPGATDTMQWVSPDAPAYGYPPTGVTNPYAATFPQSGNLIDSTKGDRAYLIHYKNNGSGVYSILEDIEYTNITETDGTPLSITGTMKAINGLTTDPNIKITQFDAIYAGLTDSPTVNKSFYIGDNGYNGTEGTAGGALLIKSDISSLNTDTDFGSLAYGTVTPSGTPFFAFQDQGTRTYTVGSNTFNFGVGSEILNNTIPVSASPVIPVVGRPSSALVNGADFFTNQTLSTTAPQISWSAPSIGTAQYYQLQVVDLSDSIVSPPTWNFYTQSFSVTLPSGLLQKNKSYIFMLTAVYSPGTSFLTAPFRIGTQIAYTYQTSGLATVSSTATSTKRAAATQASHTTVQVTLGPDGRLHFQHR